MSTTATDALELTALKAVLSSNDPPINLRKILQESAVNQADLLFIGATRRTNARNEAIAVNTMDLVFVHMVPPPSRPVFSALAMVLGVVLMFGRRMLRLVSR
jgi:hypothetical protein